MERSLVPEALRMADPPAGGGQDFDSLVRQHRPRIFRFLLASLRDRDAAENLTQDCFVRAFKAHDRFRGGSSLGTWLMHIAANLVRDHEANRRLKFWKRGQRFNVDLNPSAIGFRTKKSPPRRWLLRGNRWKPSGRSRRSCPRGSARCFCSDSSKTWTYWKSPQ